MGNISVERRSGVARWRSGADAKSTAEDVEAREMTTLQAPQPPTSLRDGFGRSIRKLRISLIDACNFRCFYCMPEQPKFKPFSALLTAGEIVGICSQLNRFGLSHMRMTGGEPTLRGDFDAIVRGLSELPLTKLGLTTNGFLLHQKLDLLADSACRHINLSLDSLRADRFQRITGTTHFERVRRNILAARARDLQVKLNVVVCRGTNDDELLDFVAFSAAHGIPVRFLELMKIGPRFREFGSLFVSADEMMETIRSRHDLRPLPVEADSTSFVFRTEHGAEIGFIASESRPFCSSCSRLRLSATGHLRACLMSERGLNVRGLSAEQLQSALRAVMGMKPGGRLPHVEQAMYQIGG
jgi:GTP 3',8-cyclase